MLSPFSKKTACAQLFVRVSNHSACKERWGRDYASFLAKSSVATRRSTRGTCPNCNGVFKRLDYHLRVSANCKQPTSLGQATCTVSREANTEDAMNTGEPQLAMALPTTQPHPTAPVYTTTQPNIQLLPPFKLPQPDEDWELDNVAL